MQNYQILINSEFSGHILQNTIYDIQNNKIEKSYRIKYVFIIIILTSFSDYVSLRKSHY